MSIFPNKATQDLKNLYNLAEQQKNQGALIIKNKNLKQTQDKKLAETVSPISKKFEAVNESTESLADVSKQTKSEDGNIQTPAQQNILVMQSVRDTLAFMNGSKVFFLKLVEKDNAEVIWITVLIKPNPLGQKRLRLKIMNSK